jgi:hypothetical protein
MVSQDLLLFGLPCAYFIPAVDVNGSIECRESPSLAASGARNSE